MNQHTVDPILSELSTIKNITKSNAREIHRYLDNVERELEPPSPVRQAVADVRQKPSPAYTGALKSPEEIRQLPESEQFRYYQELPMSGVMAHARKNLGGNAREVIGGLAKFVTLTVLPEFVLWKDEWKSEKRALWNGIGQLAAGAFYEGLLAIRDDATARGKEMYDRIGVDAPIRTMRTHRGRAYYHLLDYPPLKKFMDQPSTLFNAVVDMYKNNWGWGSWGETGIKRYFAEQPLDMLADISIVLSWLAQGTATVTKAGSLVLKSEQLQQLRYSKFYQSKIQKYVPIESPKLNQIFQKAEERFGKVGDNLEWMSDQTKYIGTGVHGRYPPGYWAKMANIVINYMDVGAVPFLLGGQLIGGVSLVGGTTRPQLAAELRNQAWSDEYQEAAATADRIAQQLFEKYGDQDMLPEEIIEHYYNNTLMRDPLPEGASTTHAWELYQRTLQDWARIEHGMSSHIAQTRDPYKAGQQTLEHLHNLSKKGVTNVLAKYPELDLEEIRAVSGFKRTWKYYDDWKNKHDPDEIYPGQYTKTNEVIDFPTDAFRDMAWNLYFHFAQNEYAQRASRDLLDIEKQIDDLFQQPNLDVKKYEELVEKEKKTERYYNQEMGKIAQKHSLANMKNVQEIVIDNMTKHSLEHRPEFIDFLHHMNLDLYDNLEAVIKADKLPAVLQDRKDELLLDVQASKRFYESALQHANATYSQVLFDGLAKLEDPAMSRNLARVLLSHDILPTEQIGGLLDTLDENSRRVVRATAMRELFEKSRSWENVFIRKNRITEPQLADSYDHELSYLINNPHFPDSERKEFSAENFERLKASYAAGDMQDVVELLIAKEFNRSRKGLVNKEQMQGPPEPGTAYVVDRDAVDWDNLPEGHKTQFERAKKNNRKYLVFRTGTFASGQPRSYQYFRDDTMADNKLWEGVHDDAIISIVRSDNVIAYGIKQPLEEPIVRTEGIINRAGLKTFDEYYRRGQTGQDTGIRNNVFERTPWIPPTALRAQLDRVGPERLVELFGDDITRDLYRYALSVDTLPDFINANNLTPKYDLIQNAIDPNGRLHKELGSLSALIPMFGNGDAYLDYLELVFNLAGNPATLGFLGTAGGIEAILRHVPAPKRAAARTWLNDYRKWTSAVLRSTEEPQHTERPMRTRVTNRRTQ